MSDQSGKKGGPFRSLLGQPEGDDPRLEPPPPPPPGVPGAPVTIDLAQAPGDRGLIEAIEGSDPALRRGALHQLIGRELTPPLAQAASVALRDPQPDIRMLALTVIERAPRLVPIERLEAATVDWDPAIRGRALAVLGRTQRASVLTTVHERLAAETEEIVIDAGLVALGQLLQTAVRPFPPSSLEDVCRAVARLTASSRARHRDVLGLISKVIREADLVELLSDDDDAVRCGSAVLATERGSAAAGSALAQHTNDDVPEIRRLAEEAALRAQRDSGAETQSTAGFDIDRFGRRADDVVKRIQSSPGREGAGAPGEIGPPHSVGIGALAERLVADPVTSREAVRRTLEEIETGALVDWAEGYLAGGQTGRARNVAALVAHLGRTELIPFLARSVLELSEGAEKNEVAAVLRPFGDTWRLIDILQEDPSADRRAKGLRLAAAIDPLRLRPILVGLRDSQTAIRLEAIALSGRVLTGEVANRLLNIIKSDTSPKARAAAVTRFWDAGATLRVRAADEALRTHLTEARVAAVELLTGNSDEELGLLARVIHDRDIKVASRAISHLASLRAPEALAVLWSSLRLVVPEVQELILEAMEEFDREAVVFLGLQSLDSADPNDRVLGLSVLSRLKTDSGDRSLMALDDPSPSVRLEALRNVMKKPKTRAVDAVGARLRDPEPAVRALALQVLESIQDERTLPYFVDGAKDPSPEVRRTAKAALLRHSSDAVIDLLLRALDFPTHRRAAADLLIEMGRPAVERLTAALPDASPHVARTIGEILVGADATSSLIGQLAHREPEQRLRAVSGLGAIRSHQAVPALIERLRDPDASVRARTAKILGDLRDVRAIEPLKRAFISDPDMTVVRAIEPALRRLTGDPR